MEKVRILALLLIAMVSLSTRAADPVVPVHWYRITISTGAGNTISFTGSSQIYPSEMSDRVNQTTPIVLENRREQSGEGGDIKWYPYEVGSKIYISPKTVLYFEELAGDPAAPHP